MNHMAFIDYLNTVDDLLEAQYGITSRDIDTAAIAQCQEDAWAPQECVQWLADKYELERIDLGPYGGMASCKNDS